MKLGGIFQCLVSDHNPQQQQATSEGLLFSGNDENYIKNGAILLEERITRFDGRTNPIRCFSVDDLNLVDVAETPIIQDVYYQSHEGVWDEKYVLVKIFRDDKIRVSPCREIAVATQMGSHINVHRLIGCCLDTDRPVLVYERPEQGTLHDRILRYKEKGYEPIEWKERLRIGWEIAHAVAYLHTAFRRPIIHRDLRVKNVVVDRDGAAKLSDFGLSISIPEGEIHVTDPDYKAMGTFAYLAPDYLATGKLAANSDVYAFGMLLLVVLTGKPWVFRCESNYGWVKLLDWVRDCSAANCLSNIVDPSISADGLDSKKHFQRDLKSVVELSLQCTSEDEECRPTMVDVATKLKNIYSLHFSLLTPFD